MHAFVGASADYVPSPALPHEGNEFEALAREAVGLKIYMDQTYGPLRVGGLATLMRYFRNWPKDKPIALHAEGTSIAVGIGLAAAFGRSVHICHVSRQSEITLIAAAKQRGIGVTCEVTPHHLFLTEDDLPHLGTLGDMRPRLATRADVDALWSHINTTIDCIATDHAPHTLDEKRGPDSPPGVPGLETALPLMLTAVAQGRLSLSRLVELMALNPRRIYKLPDQPDTWIEADTAATSVITDSGLHTKCGWSPFSGMEVTGRICSVRLRGTLVYRDGEIIPTEAVHS